MIFEHYEGRGRFLFYEDFWKCKIAGRRISEKDHIYILRRVADSRLGGFVVTTTNDIAVALCCCVFFWRPDYTTRKQMADGDDVTVNSPYMRSGDFNFFGDHDGWYRVGFSMLTIPSRNTPTTTLGSRGSAPTAP